LDVSRSLTFCLTIRAGQAKSAGKAGKNGRAVPEMRFVSPIGRSSNTWAAAYEEYSARRLAPPDFLVAVLPLRRYTKRWPALTATPRRKRHDRNVRYRRSVHQHNPHSFDGRRSSGELRPSRCADGSRTCRILPVAEGASVRS